MPTRYYVTAKQYVFPYASKRLCGPFEHRREASAMVAPVRAAIASDPEYANITVEPESVTKPKGKPFKPGALDPARIGINEVIKASVKQ